MPRVPHAERLHHPLALLGRCFREGGEGQTRQLLPREPQGQGLQVLQQGDISVLFFFFVWFCDFKVKECKYLLLWLPLALLLVRGGEREGSLCFENLSLSFIGNLNTTWLLRRMLTYSSSWLLERITPNKLMFFTRQNCYHCPSKRLMPLRIMGTQLRSLN